MRYLQRGRGKEREGETGGGEGETGGGERGRCNGERVSTKGSRQSRGHVGTQEKEERERGRETVRETYEEIRYRRKVSAPSLLLSGYCLTVSHRQR